MTTRKYMLAYGMNTNLHSMTQRCPKAISMGKVTLNGYRLVFKHFCDVVVDQNASLECALWSITEECEASLDILEGFPYHYNKKEVQVMFNNKAITAIIYYMQDVEKLNMPSPSYYRMVEAGYRDHNINSSQLTLALGGLAVCG